MTQRGNGGIVGVQNNPTLSVASGVWSVNEVQRAAVVATWPLTIVPDPNFRNVTLLLNGEGTNGAQNNTFIDSSTNNFTVTRNGNPTQGTFSPFGSNWSNYFDGSGDLLTFPSSSAFDFSATPNTFEFWLYPLALPPSGNACRVFMAGANDSQNAFVIEYTSNGTISSGVPFGGNTGLATPSGTLQLQQWQHFAIVQNGASSAIYKNGVQVATGTITGPSSGAVPFKIGYDNVATVDFQYFGYISNFRIVKGAAVYTANFTPPTTPLTAISGTSLLTCQSNRLRDASTNNFTITRNGDVNVQRFSPFSPTAPYAAATIGGSGYFDGSGDLLTFPSSSAFDFSATPNTFEFWLYPLALPQAGNACRVFMAGSNGNQNALMIEFGSNGAIGMGVPLSGNAALTAPAGTLRLNEWQHFAIVQNGASSAIYKNGVQVATGTIANPSSGAIAAKIGFDSVATVNFQYFGYISNFRIVKGTAVYTTNFTPPTAPVTAIANTNLLLNFTNGGVIDNSMLNVFETFGGAQISTSIRRYGSGSIAFNGTNSYLSLLSQPHLNLSTGDFTIELWFYTTTATTAQQIFIRRAAVAARGLQLSISGVTSQRITFFAGDTSTLGWEVSLTGATSLASNTWHHIAVTRSGNTFTLWVNGVSDATASSAVAIADDTSPFLIGVSDGGGAFVNGFIDDFRITRGVARYTANFTPPTLALSGL